MTRTALLLAFLAASACATSQKEPPPAASSASGQPSEARIMSAAGTEIGKVDVTPAPKGVLLHVTISAGGLSPGWHGIHLHAMGTCADGAAGFTASGDHVMKSKSGHGFLYPYGPEDGDLPNLSVAADGSASVEIFSDLTTLAALQDADGLALIIHAKPDDHMTQPIGGAGDRVACAVIPK